MLSYKAESAGKKLIKVDPRGTSQKCSCCGCVVKKDLSDRTHECPFCGFVCDRDYNASRNILILGMGQPFIGHRLRILSYIINQLFTRFMHYINGVGFGNGSPVPFLIQSISSYLLPRSLPHCDFCLNR